MMKKWNKVPVVVTLVLVLVFSGALGERVVRADELGEEIEIEPGVIARPLSTDPGEKKIKVTSYRENNNIHKESVSISPSYLVKGKRLEVESIGTNVFHKYNTTELKSVILGQAIKVERNAFKECPNLNDIQLHGVRVLDGGFYALPKLTKLDLLLVEELGEGAFTDCKALNEVAFMYGNPYADLSGSDLLTANKMSADAFTGCEAVSEVRIDYVPGVDEKEKGLLQKIKSSLPKAKLKAYLISNQSVDEADQNPKLNTTEVEAYAYNSDPIQLEIINLYAQLKEGMTITGQTIEKKKLNGKYEWSSDKPEVASIDDKGMITPHSPGIATITLKITYEGKSKSTQCKVKLFGDFEFDEEQGTIIRYRGTNSKVTIPNKINGVIVKKIGAGSFADREDITNITIPDTIIEIGENAFKGCTGLSSKGIVIPNSINSIASGAFAEVVDLNIKVLYSGETDESGTPVIRHSVFEAAGIDDKITGYIIGVTPEYKPVLNMTEIKDLKAGSDPVELTASGLYPENLPAEINESNSSMEPLEVKWKSSKPSVAQVSSDGLVTPVSAGTAVITADIQGRSVSCKVQVTGGSLTVAEPDGMKLTEAAKAVLAKTEPIKSAVAAGQDTTVLMIFEEKGKNEVADDAQAIDDILKEGQEAAAYYNIAFQAVIDGRMPVNVDETAGNIELEFSLDGIKKAASYKVARVHNGQAELLNAKLSPEEETLTAGSSLFSTYAIIREQENIQTPLKENENTVKIVKKPKSPVRSSLDTTPAKTGDNSHTAGVAGLTLLMLAILLRVGRNSLIKHK